MPGFHQLLALSVFLSLLCIANVRQGFAWQQRVHYRMWIDLDAPSHSYAGRQQLTYVNNSPDTLREVYYHLFYNAFKPGSVMDRRDREPVSDRRKNIGLLPSDQQGDVSISSLRQNGTLLHWSIEETILHVRLARPLLPGDSTLLEMEWRTVIPKIRRRGGWMNAEGVEFSMSQWYPKLAEYDRHGWHPDEYVDREFYGVFGTFDVEITLPASYVVGGTGRVTNPMEVGCGYQFEDRDTLVVNLASDSGRKTWKFHAENVHDFAWVADREYAHQIVIWGDVPIHLLFKWQSLTGGRPSGWRNAGAWTADILEYFSNRFGEYAWPSFTVAQAGDGGMEYPMLIMITGSRNSRSFFRVIAHEIGHQWYYGMMANNETQEAWLDEGLTQYLTDEADRALNGEDTANRYSGLDKVVYPWDQERWRDVYSYYLLATSGYAEPLNTFHDHFREGLTASLVYYKGEAVVRQLQYMLGDSLFDAAMRRYYDEWRFRHPSARDFERVMEEASGMRLDWFFNQWIGSDKTCDYAFDDISSERQSDGSWLTTVRLSNRDEIVMPLELTLTYSDGTTATANIPVESWRKPGADISLPRWNWVDRSYETTFVSPKRVVRGEIDPSVTLPDLDRTNNTAIAGFPASLFPSSHVALYRRWDMRRPLDRYSIRLRPSIWYSQADGIQPGFMVDGGYAFEHYRSFLGLYYNLESERLDYRASYETDLGLLGRLGSIAFSGANVDGVSNWGIELKKKYRPYYFQSGTSHEFTLAFNHSRLLHGNYPNDVAPWDAGDYNTVGLGYMLDFDIGWRRVLRFNLDAEASFASHKEFEQIRLRGEWNTSWLGLGFATSLFVGTSGGDVPSQQLFNAAGASSMSMHKNPVHRLFMNADPEFAARNHLLLPTEGWLTSLTEARDAMRFGRHVLNAKLQVSGLNPLKLFRFWPLNRFDLQQYAAAGWLFPDNVTFDGFEDYTLEAGVVASVDLFNLFLPRVVQDAIDSPVPVKLSFIVPLWAESPLLREEGFAFRWGIGVSM